MCGLSLLVENPRRFAELNLYCLPRAIETVYNSSVEHATGSSLKFHQTPVIDVVLFGWSVAVLFWALQHKEAVVRRSFRTVLSHMLGVN